MRRLNDVFPYSSYRPHQKQLIEFIFDIFDKEKVGLAYAATGLGKSIAVLAAHLLNPRSKLFICTRTKSQAKIYAKELVALRKELPDVTYTFIRSKQELCAIVGESKKLQAVPYGVFIKICEALKRTGKCPYFETSFRGGAYTPQHTNVALRLLERGATAMRIFKAGVKNRLCPYELARYLCRISNIIVGTYSYIFDDAVRENFLLSIDTTTSDLRVVVDEAHNLPDFIISTHTKKLSTWTLGSIHEKLERINATLREEVSSEVFETALDITRTLLEELERKGSEIAPHSAVEVDISDVISSMDFRSIESLVEASYVLLREVPDLASQLLRVYDFIDYYARNYTDESHITTIEPLNAKGKQHYLYRLILLDPSKPAKDIIQQIKSVVLLSGSLHPVEYYRISLGLNTEPLYNRTETIVLPSPFPPNNLRVYVDTELSTKYSERTPLMLQMYAERIRTIISEIPHVGILVLFPSYTIMNSIHQLLGPIQRTIITEKKKTKLSTLVQLLLETNAVIFAVAGGKFAEGIDYTHRGKTLIRVVIIAGLPFPEYNVYLIKRREYYERILQNHNLAVFITIISPMLRRVLQATGRLIRSEKDRGVVFILDRRYGKYSRFFYPKVPWQVYEPYKGNRQLREILTNARQFLEH
ncbi:MAG: ATP-dependent DNA helicase [Candidatus Korarchaeota archaeon]|nr:ATP-dependent DNA helicase [Thermoproteota archaeon]